ncbi:hypothetical protein K0M31_014301 [Melipona bicolor]|uniref:Uncharacterized protein n=1 Tax=Melipona bicolor TaxID=60889 RepID=A0AA40G8D1_9HYME|nr:hypothetical protein K0M31_014301 [Melipona bicolor]
MPGNEEAGRCARRSSDLLGVRVIKTSSALLKHCQQIEQAGYEIGLCVSEFEIPEKISLISPRAFARLNNDELENYSRMNTSTNEECRRN